MLYVQEDGSIKLTRGDTARLTVSITNDLTKDEYQIADTDVLTLSIKKSIRDTTTAVQKSVTGSGTFYIEPVDTKDLEFGKYKYDVQLTTSGGEIYTVISPNDFEIMQEVTC